jgi:branched-chain amino acid transport system ATP-binding protein
MPDAVNSVPVAPPAPAAATPLLAVAGVTVRFGGITALDGVTFDIAAGQICGLIGPNGAGKTTLFNCISRLYQPVSGDLRVAGESLLPLRPHEVASRGVARTFQNLALLPRVSVLDNVLVGGHVRPDAGGTYGRSRGLFAEVLGTRRAAERERALRAGALERLRFVGLDGAADRTVGSLPLGSRKRVELARALMSDPRLLLLDEPAGGLTLDEVRQLDDLIRSTRDRLGTTILLVEHRMALIQSVCDHVVVLDFGRTIARGTPAEVGANPAVVTAYLGASA